MIHVLTTGMKSMGVLTFKENVLESIWKFGQLILGVVVVELVESRRGLQLAY